MAVSCLRRTLSRDFFDQVEVPVFHHFPTYRRILASRLFGEADAKLRVRRHAEHLLRQIGRIVRLEERECFFAEVVPNRFKPRTNDSFLHDDVL